MIHGIFITGTDTDVGKTVVAAACLHRYRGQARLRYWKPIQTGIERDDDTATVRLLGECEEVEVFDQGVRLQRPLSPHLAARLSGEEIELEPITRLINAQRVEAGLVVEGAGGALVPINDKLLIIDLITSLALPAVVVARSGLGTINHTLLTLEALRRRSLPIAGVVMVGEVNKENRAAIERYGAATVLGEMPRFTHLTAENLKRWAQLELDPSGLLAECFND